MGATPASVAAARSEAGAAGRKPWLEHWLATVADLSALTATHPMMDAVIDEVDGRMIRVGDHWLADFASCNYLGFDLDREIIDAVPAYLDAWGTHPSWSRLLGSPVLYEEIEAKLTALLGSEDSLVLPTITHIHMSVIPLLAASGTIFLDARAHKTIYDGCQVAKSRGAAVRRFRFEDPDHLDELMRNGARPHAPRLHGRRELDDRQPAGPRRLRRGRAPPRRAALRRRRPRLRRDRRAAARARPTPYGHARQQHRPLRRRELRQPRARRRLLQGLLVAAGVHRLPARGQAAAQGRRAAVPLLGPVARRVAGHRAGRLRRQRDARRRAAHRAAPADRAACSARSPGSASRRPTARGCRSSRSRCATTRGSRDVGRFLFDQGVYVTLAAYPLVPKERGRLPRAAHGRQHRRGGRPADPRARGARRRAASCAPRAPRIRSPPSHEPARSTRGPRVAGSAWLVYLAVGALLPPALRDRPAVPRQRPGDEPPRALRRWWRSSSACACTGRRRRAPWRWFAVGFALFWFGDLYTYSYPLLLDGDVPFPSPGDGAYLLVYPVLMAGLRAAGPPAQRRARTAAGVIDGLILTVGLVAAVLGGADRALRPRRHAVARSPRSCRSPIRSATCCCSPRPSALALDAGRREPAFYLVSSSIVLLLVTDFVYGVLILHGAYDHQLWLDLGWIGFYLLWGAAALHPSMARMEQRRRRRGHRAHALPPRAAQLRVARRAGHRVRARPPPRRLSTWPSSRPARRSSSASSCCAWRASCASRSAPGARADAELGRRRAGRGDRAARRSRPSPSDSARWPRGPGEHRAGAHGATLRRAVLVEEEGTVVRLDARGAPGSGCPRAADARPAAGHDPAARRARAVLLVCGAARLVDPSVAGRAAGAGHPDRARARQRRAERGGPPPAQRGALRVARPALQRPHHRARARTATSTTRARRSSACSATTPESVVGAPFTDLVEPADRVRIAAPASRAPSPAPSTRAQAIECTLVHKDGSMRAVRDPDHQPARGRARRAASSSTAATSASARRSRQQLAHQAFHDAVTGLANRALFAERVRHAIARSRREERGCAVLFLDLDDFKDDQRQPRPRRRRRGADRGRPPARLEHPRRRHRGALRRRRVRRAARGRRERARRRPTPPSGCSRRSPSRCAPATRRSPLRCSLGISVAEPDGTRRRRRDDPRRRRRDVHRQARRQGRLPHCSSRRMHEGVLERLELRTDLQRAHRQRASSSSTTSRSCGWTTGASRASRRCCAGTIPSAAWCRPTSSSRSPRRPGLIVPIGRWVLREGCRHATRMLGAMPGHAPSMSHQPLAQADPARATSWPTSATRSPTSGLDPQQPDAGDHRDRPDGRRRARRAAPARAQGARRAARAGRLRHRLLVAELPEPASRSTSSRWTARS